MGGGSVMNGAAIYGDVLFARNHLFTKMSVVMVLQYMPVSASTAAPGWIWRYDNVSGNT